MWFPWWMPFLWFLFVPAVSIESVIHNCHVVTKCIVVIYSECGFFQSNVYCCRAACSSTNLSAFLLLIPIWTVLKMNVLEGFWGIRRLTKARYENRWTSLFIPELAQVLEDHLWRQTWAGGSILPAQVSFWWSGRFLPSVAILPNKRENLLSATKHSHGTFCIFI